MNNLTKKSIIAVSANALATTVKLGVNLTATKALGVVGGLKLAGFEFAKSFVTSTLPALAVNATPDFFANKLVNFGVDAVESAAITGALGVAEWKLAPEFLKSSGFITKHFVAEVLSVTEQQDKDGNTITAIKGSAPVLGKYKFSGFDVAVNVVNTFVQAEAFNYFTQDDLSPELAEVVDLEFGA